MKVGGGELVDLCGCMLRGLGELSELALEEVMRGGRG